MGDFANLINHSRVLVARSPPGAAGRRKGDDVSPKRALVNRKVCISFEWISFN